MGTLIENLSQIESIKGEIKSAIESKGVDMTNVSFPDYPAAIASISTAFVTETLSVTANGTYYPSEGVDGFSEVVVDVPQDTGWTEKDLTEGLINIVNLNNSASYVASSAFANNKTIQTVTLPNCTLVGRDAFSGCNYLSNISLNNVTSIGYGAFQWTSLTSVDLPNCTYVGGNGFLDCHSLISVNLPECSVIEYGGLARCSNLETISLPKLKSVQGVVFSGCRSLTYVSLPECTLVSAQAFNYCSNLSGISLPECSYIGYSVFTNLKLLSDVYIPKCEYIGDNAFFGCNLISSVSLTECSYIGNSAFNGCYLISSIYLPNCFSIGSSAFFNCSALEEISAPLVFYLGSSAFVHRGFVKDSTLSIVDFPNLIETMGPFFSCTGIQKVNLPIIGRMGANMSWDSTCPFEEISYGNKTYMMPNYDSNFYFSNVLTTGGVIYVDAAMYDRWISASGWSSLSTAFVSQGDPTVPMLSFSDGLLYGKTEGIFDYWYQTGWYGMDISINPSSVITMYLPNCRMMWGKLSISNVTTISIPECIYIGDQVFSGCNSLVSIDLPKCKYIGQSAFRNCRSLTSITLGTSKCYMINNNALTGCPASIYVPSSYVDDYKSAPNWSFFASRIFPIPE